MTECFVFVSDCIGALATVKIQDMRRVYELGALEREHLSADPVEQFQNWLEVARTTPAPDWLEVNAMTLATSDGHGHVSARIVLLKTVSRSGFTFFTNYRSAKAEQLSASNQAALVFYWPHVERQVRVEGTVTQTDSETNEEYFHARPRTSQIGAIVSPQSQPIAQRKQLELAAAELAARYGETQTIPCPDYWGGYCLKPDKVEFWQGRPSRLHDRFVYAQSSDGWSLTRLAP